MQENCGCMIYVIVAEDVKQNLGSPTGSFIVMCFTDHHPLIINSSDVSLKLVVLSETQSCLERAKVE